MSCVEDISMLVHLDANSKLYLRRIPVLRHVLIHLQMFCFRTQCIKSKTFEKCLKPHCRIRPFHESFTETDAIGCEAQLNRKVPPNENNFSWARFSLLLRLRPVKWAQPTESRLSLPAHVLEFVWNTFLIHLLKWPHSYLFLREIVQFLRKMSTDRERTFWKFGTWFISRGQA